MRETFVSLLDGNLLRLIKTLVYISLYYSYVRINPGATKSEYFPSKRPKIGSSNCKQIKKTLIKYIRIIKLYYDTYVDRRFGELPRDIARRNYVPVHLDKRLEQPFLQEESNLPIYTQKKHV